VALEALARWQHPERGQLAPAEFVPLAESCALIAPLTRSILRQALERSRAWDLAGHRLTVSVNVAAPSGLAGSLVEDVHRALLETRALPARLCLEITETAIMHDPDRALEVLGSLRGLGVTIALDDFGTGYSSSPASSASPSRRSRSTAPSSPTCAAAPTSGCWG
jgi:EAL domain-containing protein (putative c-di-GMP-specific phosphodiesterase class I)